MLMGWMFWMLYIDVECLLDTVSMNILCDNRKT